MLPSRRRRVGLDVGLELRGGTVMKFLTDARARTMLPGERPISAGGVSGLYLVPGSSRGRGKWILRFVSPITGKRRDMGLGRYPETGIAVARDAALSNRKLIASGDDPIEVRTKIKKERTSTGLPETFEEAAKQVHAEIEPGFRNRKHAAQWITTLESYAFPAIGKLPVAALRAADFAEALRPIWLTKPETASRVRQRMDTVMKWCTARELAIASPVDAVEQLLPRQPGKRERVQHHPAVPWRDLPSVFADIAGDRRPLSLGKQVLALLILSGCRSGELRGMKWDEVDVATATWTVPATRMKKRLAHRVPLSRPCLKVLRDRLRESGKEMLVFPSRSMKPLSDMVLTKILRDAGIASDTAGRVATAHGFRSTFRDWASEHGFSRSLADRALAHAVRDQTEAAYHRTDLLDARRPMMEQWAAFVCEKTPWLLKFDD